MTRPELTYKRIFSFWIPLAGTWLMMAVEGPFLAALIARLPAPTENLAAFGVAFAFGIIIESPVIMLMSASTALVEDRRSYLALRRFAYGLSAILTAVQLLVLVPPVFDRIALGLLDLPAPVARLTYVGLALLLPWTPAIGYRRFRQGLLIRYNLTQWVAYGTIIRLTTMSLTAFVVSRLPSIEGVYVATAALSGGVVAEALASRVMTRPVVRQLLEEDSPGGSNGGLTLGDILSFYTPLALTSLLAMAVQPLVTFFMGQSRAALESLAVLPVIHGLTFLFRSLGLSYQEVGIALLGERGQHYERLRNFAVGLALGAAACLAVIAFSDLGTLWFHRVSGLSPELTRFALVPTKILAILPALSVWLSFQRSVLVHARFTAPITWATMVEVSGVALVLMLAIHGLGLIGAIAASAAIVVGRVAGTLVLVGALRGGHPVLAPGLPVHQPQAVNPA